MSETEDYIAMNNWMIVNCDMGRTLETVVMTEFRVLSQLLFGGTTENHETTFLSYAYGCTGRIVRIPGIC
jgi:hypothetical protein